MMQESLHNIIAYREKEGGMEGGMEGGRKAGSRRGREREMKKERQKERKQWNILKKNEAPAEYTAKIHSLWYHSCKYTHSSYV